MSMRRVLLISFLLSSFILFAQDRQISGRVTSISDPNGLPGVNVVVKGTSKGVITDLEGRFVLEAASGSTLIFSFIGYKTQEIPITNQTTISLQLEEEPKELSEVIVVGYSSVEKRDLTGSITSVKS